MVETNRLEVEAKEVGKQVVETMVNVWTTADLVGRKLHKWNGRESWEDLTIKQRRSWRKRAREIFEVIKYGER